MLRSLVTLESTQSDDPQTGHNITGVKRVRCFTPNCCVFMWCNVVLLYVAFLALRPTSVDVSGHFRASEFVARTPTEGLALQRLAQLQHDFIPLLHMALDVHTDLSCLGAPNFRKYLRILVLRDESATVPPNTYRALYDVEIVALHGERTPQQEFSLMCYEDRDGQVRSMHTKRASAITAKFKDAHNYEYTQRFQGLAALCIQHYVDVFDGWWPCVSSEENDIKFPRHPPLSTK